MNGAAGYREEFVGCLREAFLEVAKAGFSGEEQTVDSAMRCYERHFQVMMGATNLTRVDVEEAFLFEAETQRRFHESLSRIAEKLDAEVQSPGQVYTEPHWDFGLTSGCNIRLGGDYLYAAPLVPAATGYWMILSRNPVAADVVYAGDGVALFLPAFHDIDEHGVESLCSFIGDSRDVSGDFPGSWGARVGGGVLLLDSGEAMSSEVLDGLLSRHGVEAVVKVNSGNFSGFIHTGLEGGLPKLHVRVLFEWSGNWGIFSGG